MRRFLILLAVLPEALAGCSAVPGAAPVETVTVTASAASKALRSCDLTAGECS